MRGGAASVISFRKVKGPTRSDELDCEAGNTARPLVARITTGGARFAGAWPNLTFCLPACASGASRGNDEDEADLWAPPSATAWRVE
jgi:hypothetical protein